MSADTIPDEFAAFRDRFDELVPNPLDDLLAQLDVEELLAVLQSKPRSQWIRLLDDLRAPSRTLNRTTAERALGALRRVRSDLRGRAARWLFVPLGLRAEVFDHPSHGSITRELGRSLVADDNITPFAELAEEWGSGPVALGVYLLSLPNQPAVLACLLSHREHLPSTWPLADPRLADLRQQVLERIDQDQAEGLGVVGVGGPRGADPSDEHLPNEEEQPELVRRVATRVGASGLLGALADEGELVAGITGGADDVMFVPAAVDPEALVLRATDKRALAQASRADAALRAEADLYELLVQIAELAAGVPALARRAVEAAKAQVAELGGAPEEEAEALAELLAGEDGPVLRDLLAGIAESRRAGANDAVVAGTDRLTSDYIHAWQRIPKTISAAMTGMLELEPPYMPDPIAEFLAEQGQPATGPSKQEPVTGSRDQAASAGAADVADGGAASAGTDVDETEESEGEESEGEVDEPTPKPAAHMPAEQAEPVAVSAEQTRAKEPPVGGSGPAEGVDGAIDEDADVARGTAGTEDRPPTDTESDADVAAVRRPPRGAVAENGTETIAGDGSELEPATEDEDEDGKSARSLAALTDRLAGTDDEFDQARDLLVAAGAWGAVGELDRRLSEPTVAWEVAALSEAIRAPYGELVSELAARIGELTPRVVRQRPAQLIGLVAAVRVPYVSPFAGASAASRALASVLAEDFPGLTALAAASWPADEINFSYAAEAVGVAADAAASDQELQRLGSEATAVLERSGRNMFARSSWIWDTWIAPSGELRMMLDPIARVDLAALDQVREVHDRLSRRSGITELINDADRRFRQQERNRIEGSARRALVRAVEEAISLAGAWLNVAGQAVTAGRAAPDRRAETLRRGFVNALPDALAELNALLVGDDCSLAAAATAALRILGPVEAMVVDGRPIVGREPSVAVALRGDLLRSDCPLTPGLEVDTRRVEVVDLAAAATRSAIEAFEHRLDAAQYGLARLVVDELGRTGGNVAALHQRVDAGLAAASAVRDARVAEVKERFSAARRFGRLEADTAEALGVALEAAEGGDRIDVDRVNEELDLICAELDRSVERARERFASTLEQAIDAQPAAVEGVRSRIDALLASSPPDLAAAEDLLQRALDGQELNPAPAATAMRMSAEFVAACVDGITDQAIDACARGAAEPINFSGLDADAAALVAGALRTWFNVSTRQRPISQSWAKELSSVLRLLGLSGQNLYRQSSDRDTARFDLTAASRQGKALVPEFGSLAMGAYAFLLVWDKPTVDSLLSRVKEDARESQATIVLHFGTMAMDRRYELANRLRRSRHRPLIVVDDAVMLYLARIGKGMFDDLMRATLPFASVNPYFIGGGDVPVEMFYGRIGERTDVMENPDRTLIYGGRRLGKSALLRSAKARFEEGDSNRRAVMVTLDEAGIGQHRRPGAVWDLLVPALATAGVLRQTRRHRDPAEAGAEGVRRWLDGDPARRLLVLLDEADDFFDADAEANFAQTKLFRSLKEDYPGRFKPVFAGLHQVARFAHHHNQPFAQLVNEEAPIGPLPPLPARQLLTQPLGALGWEFATDELVDRILHGCNYIPILIQEFGQELVKRLYAREMGPDSLPAPILAEDIDAVLHTQRFADQARRRIEVTLELDHRYKVIAWTVHLSLVDTPTTEALYEECRALWPDGFASTNFTEFRALVDELVQLGILSLRNASGIGPRTWRIRGHNVGSWLGTESEVETRLADLVRDNPPVGSFYGAGTRRELEVGGGRTLSPLTEGQLSDVVGRGRTQVRIVVGTPATGVDHVAAAIEAVNPNAGSSRVVKVARSSRLKSALREMPEGHRVIIDDLAHNEVRIDNLRIALAEALRAPEPASGSRSTVLIVTPAQYLDLADLVAGAPGDVDFEVVDCQRYTADGLRAYTLADQGFAATADRQRVVDATGGWPLLVERVVREARRHDLPSVLSALDDQDAADLPATTGLDVEPFASVLVFLADLAGGPETAEPFDVLVDMLDEYLDCEAPRAVVDALRHGGALAEHEGRLYPEPVLVRQLVGRRATAESTVGST